MTTIRANVKSLLKRDFLTFCCVGIANTAIHAGAVIFLVELLGATSTAANTVAFFCANIFSYCANSILTFKAPLSPSAYLRFLSSSLAVLGMTVGIAAGGEYLGIHYLIVMAFLIVVSPLVSFGLVKRYAFSKKLASESEPPTKKRIVM
jgi:putative flippase GtrA